MRNIPNITLRQLACFQAVAESGSFRRAAESLQMSQPALSTQISALEHALGFPVLERRAQGARLNAAGRLTLQRVTEVLDATTRLTDFAASGLARHGGALEFGVSPTIGPYLLPSAVARLHRRLPDLRLLIREAPGRTLVERLLAGALDIAFVQLPVEDTGLTVVEVFRERLLILLSTDDPLAEQPSVRLADVRGRSVLTLGPAFELRDQVAHLCSRNGARVSLDYDGASLDSLRLMTGMGGGIAFAPECYVLSEVRPNQEVVARPIDGTVVSRGMALVWRTSQGRPRIYDALVDAVRDAFNHRYDDRAPREAEAEAKAEAGETDANAATLLRPQAGGKRR